MAHLSEITESAKARTLEEIRAEIGRNAPSWFNDLPPEVADAFLYGIAAAEEEVEQALRTLFIRSFVETSDGSYLDELGRERAVFRLPSEEDDDDAYRARIQSPADAVTVPAILERVNAALLVGTATLKEHRLDTAYALDDGQLGPDGQLSPIGFADVDFAFDGNAAFTIFIDPQVPSTSDQGWSLNDGSPAKKGSFAIDDGETNGGETAAFADDRTIEPAPIYESIYCEIDRLKAFGVSFQVVIGVL